MTVKTAIIGSGNIGTDLMFKIIRLSASLEIAAFVGIDPESDGLARASRLGVPTTADGVEGLVAMPQFEDIDIIFDATSAGAHHHNAQVLKPFGKRIIDLTPAAIGPYVVPVANLHTHSAAHNVNMVTCGGQATIPIVAAISGVVPVHYAEIVASIASKSAGPGTRANIDEFTETTARAVEQVGGAARGKAIIILNPAEPPMIMRDTVIVIVDRLNDRQIDAVTAEVLAQIARVSEYVPGYRLKQNIQFDDDDESVNILIPENARSGEYTRITTFLEVAGAAHYLPEYAGNLDIMTSAALRVAEAFAESGKAAK
jgi:acetaldehyde dehydrogenase